MGVLSDLQLARIAPALATKNQLSVGSSENRGTYSLWRYEAATAQPTLDVLRRLALALRVSTDVLVFDQDERGPDDELRLQFEALKALDPEEKKVVRSVLESILIKHDAKRWMGSGA